MKIETSKLTGIALDWAVAKCEGVELNEKLLKQGVLLENSLRGMIQNRHNNYSPSTYWDLGGPILDSMIKKGFLIQSTDPMYKNLPPFKASLDNWENGNYGETILITTMRCYVLSKLGNEIEIPDELMAEKTHKVFKP